MAKKMSFAARWGSACGTAFDAEKFLNDHPQFDWMTGILKSRPSEPWTVFTAGENNNGGIRGKGTKGQREKQKYNSGAQAKFLLSVSARFVSKLVDREGNYFPLCAFVPLCLCPFHNKGKTVKLNRRNFLASAAGVAAGAAGVAAEQAKKPQGSVNSTETAGRRELESGAGYSGKG